MEKNTTALGIVLATFILSIRPRVLPFHLFTCLHSLLNAFLIPVNLFHGQCIHWVFILKSVSPVPPNYLHPTHDLHYEMSPSILLEQPLGLISCNFLSMEIHLGS